MLRHLARRGLCTAVTHQVSADGGVFSAGTAKLVYRKAAANVIDAHHTFVPDEMRGQRIAEILSEAAFEHARASSLKVIPSCSYIRDRFVPKQAEKLGATALRSFEAPADGLQIEVAWSGVATVRLTDGRRRNPLTKSLLVSLRDWLRALERAWPARDTIDDAAVRCIVIESEGPCFSAGHDFHDFAGASADETRNILAICTEVCCLLTSVPQVTVAAVAAPAYAAGSQVASSCDLLLAHEELASFTLTGVHGGGFCHTPIVAYAAGRVPARKAFELAALGQTICAAEAAAIGLANRAVPAVDWRTAVDRTAQHLAAFYGRNSADGKTTFYRQLRAPGGELSSKYDIAVPVMVEMFQSKPWQDNMEAFLQKKKKKTDE